MRADTTMYFKTDAIEVIYRITPGDYVHIVTGKLEKEVLPPIIDYFDYKFNKPSQKQIAFLVRKGFVHIKGLTKPQASKLISIIIDRDNLGLADPWMLKALMKHQKLSNHVAYIRYANMKKETAKLILDCRN